MYRSRSSQMVRFIRQEAEEKANEISVSAEEEFDIEKLQLVEAEKKKKIKQENERKEKQVEIRKKIEYSMQLNIPRIKVPQAQDDLVNSMKEAAGKELLLVSHHHHTCKKLLKELIVQLLEMGRLSVKTHLMQGWMSSSGRSYQRSESIFSVRLLFEHLG